MHIVRDYPSGRQNALDLALNGGVTEYASDSIIADLVTTGSIMTGNSRAYQIGRNAYQWRLPQGYVAVPGPPPRADVQAELRRGTGYGRAADNLRTRPDAPVDLAYEGVD